MVNAFVVVDTFSAFSETSMPLKAFARDNVLLPYLCFNISLSLCSTLFLQKTKFNIKFLLMKCHLFQSLVSKCIRVQNMKPWRATDRGIWVKPLLKEGEYVVKQKRYHSRSAIRFFNL